MESFALLPPHAHALVISIGTPFIIDDHKFQSTTLQLAGGQKKFNRCSLGWVRGNCFRGNRFILPLSENRLQKVSIDIAAYLEGGK
ncbi:hypothetical protein TNCV_3307791 [Trichonephila clavipes]|nr:hypothetical protein TNCV_3307791 [Trichonephila clavipes]